MAVCVEQEDGREALQEVQLVGHEDARLPFEEAKHAIAEDGFGDCRVDGAERVVQQVDISVGVEGTGEGDAGALAPRDVDALLANEGLEASGEESYVRLQLAHPHHLLHSRDLERSPEQDVVGNCVGEDHRLLLHIGHSSSHPYLA